MEWSLKKLTDADEYGMLVVWYWEQGGEKKSPVFFSIEDATHWLEIRRNLYANYPNTDIPNRQS